MREAPPMYSWRSGAGSVSEGMYVYGIDEEWWRDSGRLTGAADTDEGGFELDLSITTGWYGDLIDPDVFFPMEADCFHHRCSW